MLAILLTVLVTLFILSVFATLPYALWLRHKRSKQQQQQTINHERIDP